MKDKYYEFWGSDYYIDFLHWIVRSGKPEGSSAEEIIHVVEKPWKYRKLWKKYTKKYHEGRYEV